MATKPAPDPIKKGSRLSKRTKSIIKDYKQEGATKAQVKKARTALRTPGVGKAEIAVRKAIVKKAKAPATGAPKGEVKGMRKVLRAQSARSTARKPLVNTQTATVKNAGLGAGFPKIPDKHTSTSDLKKLHGKASTKVVTRVLGSDFE
jgi:hypothetical protein